MGDDGTGIREAGAKCPVCETDVLPGDPTFPHVHEQCAARVCRDMEEAGVIEVLSKHGTTLSFALTRSFEEALDKSTEGIKFHSIKDETVDEDLLTLKGVQEAVEAWCPQGTPVTTLAFWARIIFDSLMKLKYGAPLPSDKRYGARLKEFRDEVMVVAVDQRQAELFMDSMPCPCGSGDAFSACCKPFLSMLAVPHRPSGSETMLVDWMEKYSPPIVQSFRAKSGRSVFRVSVYLDYLVNQYLRLGFTRPSSDPKRADKAIISTKNNILHSLYGSLSCLSQGLFLQSGIILRSLTEDCLVLVDLFENQGQMEKLLKKEYTPRELIPRVRRLVPKEVVSWYGYFSANFTHFGPLHPAPYLPAACYPNNFILVVGLQNIVRGVVTFHTVLERTHFKQTDRPLLWKQSGDKTHLMFDKHSPVFTWAAELGKDLTARYPPNERKEGFVYDDETYKSK